MSQSQGAYVSPAHHPGDQIDHVMVVIVDARTRQTVVRHLEQAAFRVTAVPSLAMVDQLCDPAHTFDLLVTAQSLGEMAQFGLPQLARSVDPSLPILLLDNEAAHGTGIAAAATHTIDRWPLRPRPSRRLH